MHYRVLGIIVICAVMSLTIWEGVQAQFNVQHQAPVALERNDTNVLVFNVPGISQNEIQQALLFYRYDGDFSYQQMEVSYQNGIFRADLDIKEQTAGVIEYYFEVTLLSGQTVYYPNTSPQDNPVEVEIVETLEEQKPLLEDIDYTILSPTPGNGVTEDDVLIAIALFYDKNKLEPGEFRLYLDDQDITELADTSDYYISYIPRNLGSGRHRVALEYEGENQVYRVVEWNFSVVVPGQETFTGFGPSIKPQISAELAARNQIISGNTNNAYTGRTRISGNYGEWRYSANAFLTSQESARLQPQNRYGVNVAYGNLFNFQAGHVYPSMSQFTISGRRVHGINTSLHLMEEKLNLQFIYGELDRSITNLYDSLVVQNVTNSTGDIVDNNYFLSYDENGRGTFKRKVTGGRIGIGNEDRIQFGLHALKVQDDTSSILNVRDYRDILNTNTIISGNLSQIDKDSLAQNPEKLQIRGGPVQPKDNLVAGTDLKMNFLNNQLRFESEAFISALNDNIYGGALTAERAQELGFDLNNNTADFLDQLSWLIIINENMNTLPLKLEEEEEGGDLNANTFFPTSILAGNSQVSYRHANNNLRLQYRWIGPNFYSLANSTIRKDVAGFTLTDRVNIFSNRVYLTLGYENLNDNVSGTRRATTNTITYRTNASWYPIDIELPRVSAGIRYRTRDNDVTRENFLLPEDLKNSAVQNVIQERRVINGQDSLVSIVTPAPRMNRSFSFNTSITQRFNFLDARNDVSLSFNTLNTTDEVFAYGDVSSNSFALSMSSRFRELPLETQLGMNFNSTEAGSGQNDVKITGFYAGGNYRLLDNALLINGRLAVTNNSVTSRRLEIMDHSDPDNPRDDYYVLGEVAEEVNYQTYVLQGSARYKIDEMHSLIFDANFTNVSGGNRANDRIIQLRYVFSF